MKLRFFSNGYPRGRCIVLAQQLHQVSGRAPAECVQLAERLFDAQFSQAEPAVLEVLGSNPTNELEATCASFGITVERWE